MNKSLEQRLWEKIDIQSDGECWEWIAGQNAGGYGRLKIHKKYKQAHRITWELTYGPIPTNLHVLHSCDNPPCCNPEHLFLGTNWDNVQDRERKNRNILPNSRGSFNSNARLTNLDVLQIRRLYALGNLSQHTLSVRFGVSAVHICHIIHHQRWSHLT